MLLQQLDPSLLVRAKFMHNSAVFPLAACTCKAPSAVQQWVMLSMHACAMDKGQGGIRIILLRYSEASSSQKDNPPTSSTLLKVRCNKHHCAHAHLSDSYYGAGIWGRCDSRLVALTRAAC